MIDSFLAAFALGAAPAPPPAPPEPPAVVAPAIPAAPPVAVVPPPLPSPEPAAPVLYSYRGYTHADPAYLRAWVDSLNAPRYAVAVAASPCAGGRCPAPQRKGWFGR